MDGFAFQLVPSLFRAIKAEVDRDRRSGRFLLTGSSRLLAAPDMADALVGRVELLELWPFSQGELTGTPERFVDRLFDAPRELVRSGDVTRRQLIDRVLAGGFPEAVRRQPSRRRTWFDSYVATAAQSIIRELAAIERLAEIPRLLRLCAARTADGRIAGIEVKATSTPTAAHMRGLRFLADRLGDRFHFGVLLSAAPEATPFGPRTAALPVSALWS